MVEILHRPGEAAKTPLSRRYRRTEAQTSTPVEEADEEWFDDDADED